MDLKNYRIFILTAIFFGLISCQKEELHKKEENGNLGEKMKIVFSYEANSKENELMNPSLSILWDAELVNKEGTDTSVYLMTDYGLETKGLNLEDFKKHENKIIVSTKEGDRANQIGFVIFMGNYEKNTKQELSIKVFYGGEMIKEKIVTNKDTDIKNIKFTVSA